MDSRDGDTASGLSTVDRGHLRRCVALAEVALEAGHAPFGSIVVDAEGREVFADHNRCGDGDRTQHPEFAAARWAAGHLNAEERAAATVYTSGEHCAMCVAAHGWVGLGRIVYAASTEQLGQWYRELGIAPGPVAGLRITEVVPGAVVAGPDEGLAEAVRSLHARHHARMS